MIFKAKILKELYRIGQLIAAEQNLEKLLELILDEGMKITKSDGGSIYIVETDKSKNKYLKFKIAKNSSRMFPFKETSLAINKDSISGYVALRGRSLSFNDVSKIPKEFGLKYNSSFDEKINYKTINMITIPMKDFNDEVVGVLQFINKKEDFSSILHNISTIEKSVVAYDDYDLDVISSMSSQAAVLIERTKLYNEVENLLDSFIKAMGSSLDLRDVYLAGHSERLSKYAITLAQKINAADYGKFKDFIFSHSEIKELYYAAMLHDIGKIGIKENILLKSHKISDDRINIIKYKFNILRTDLNYKSKKEELSASEINLLDKIDAYISFIIEINNKTYLSEKDILEIKKISTIIFTDIDGIGKQILSKNELENLTIKSGNLTQKEQLEFDKHVQYTYDILKDISWTSNLINIPNIASYNNNYKSLKKNKEDVPIQSKILALLDVFEALTFNKQNKKEEISLSKAINIIDLEVRANRLDPDLFNIFVHEGVYKLFENEIIKFHNNK